MHGIAYWIDKRAEITPARIALIGEDREITYREMSRSVNQLARALSHTYKLQRGDRVAILAMNSTEYLLLLFAIAKLGCVAVPLNIRLTAKELEFQIKDSGARLLIAGEELQEAAEQLADFSEELDVMRFGLKGQTSLRQQISSFSSAPFYDGVVDGSSAFIICYTSGTTGRPKGAVLTQENMFWNAINSNLAIDITSADRIITLLPLFHIGGIGLFAFPALFAGGTVVVPGKFDPDRALSMMEKYAVTIVMGVPAIHDALRKSPSFNQTDLSSARWFYSGGAPCPHELISFYLERGIAFGQGYGMTETSPTVFMLSKEDYLHRIGSIGKPAMFCDIKVVDDAGNDVKAGEVGELLIQGPNVMKEYWNLPEETAKAIKDRWLSTGDLVKRDEEGFVYIAGRKKEMLISGGENVYPLEVEQVIGEFPAVDEVAVIGVPDIQWGEVPKAILVIKSGMEFSEEELRNHCRSKLAKYKIPKTFEMVSDLPKNATGKINKALLTQQYSKKSS
jgi:fatty-acyl-CoA synthase